MRRDLRPFRDEPRISTKAGYDMWPGPHGDHGSRKYLLASLDQSLERLGLDYVDIFYSHRFDPDTCSRRRWARSTPPSGRGRPCTPASRPTPRRPAKRPAILRELGTPLLIHQPSYSMLNRWIEPDLLDALGELGVGCIVFPARPGDADRQVPARDSRGSRADRPYSLSTRLLSDEALAKIRALNEIAGQPRPDARPDGARLDASRPARDIRGHRRSSVAQLEDNVAAPREPRVLGRRARRDRPLRDGQRHQHLGWSSEA